MGLNKRYRGYKSFDYLEKDDYRAYKLVKEIDRVEPYVVSLSTAFEGLSKSCLDGVFDNLLDGGCILTSKAGWKWEDAVVDLGLRLADIEHQDFAITARKAWKIRQRLLGTPSDCWLRPAIQMKT